MVRRRIYVPPRSGTHKQARQAAYEAGLLLGATLDPSAGPLDMAPLAALPWHWDTDTVTLDGAGAGQVVLPRPGQVRGGEAWLIHRVRVYIDGGRAASPLAVATLYLGEPDPINALDATYNGGEDTAEYPNPLILNTGEYLTLVWAAGALNTPARFTIQGENVIIE